MGPTAQQSADDGQMPLATARKAAGNTPHPGGPEKPGGASAGVPTITGRREPTSRSCGHSLRSAGPSDDGTQQGD